MPAHVINGRFQILLRRRQNMAIYPLPTGAFQNVLVQCDPLTGAAQYIPGTVDNTQAFACSINDATFNIVPVNGWYDFTNYIEGDEKLSFTWDKTNSGDSKNSTVSQDGSNYDKGITSDLLFFDCAAKFIENWLLATECQILNCVEVKIIDLIARGNQGSVSDPAGNYRLFEIKSDNIEFAPVDEPCQYHIKLREQDNIWHCIHKTVIWDNWQNWFNATGTSTFQHPTFLTCVEPRPRIVHSVRMAILLFVDSFPAVLVGNAIKDLLTGEDPLETQAVKILDANKFVDAPLITTYIQNVAGLCGMTYDTIFDPGRDWENLCLYYPQAGSMYEQEDVGDDPASIVSPTQAFNYDNRWLITLADLFDKLKVVFAAEWYVTPLNKIVFNYTKDLIQLAPIYDYTLVGAEPIYGLRYTFNGGKKPAYGTYQYANDGSDLASQEIDALYSDIVDYSQGGNNPMLEGDKTKNFEFAATGFVRDGRNKDYMRLIINDGKIVAWILLLILAVVGTIFLPGLTALSAGLLLGAVVIWAGIVNNQAAKLRRDFISSPTFNGAVRVTCEQTMMPRLLLWDGINIQQAKTEPRFGMPVPNPYYNAANTPYYIKNQIGINPDATTSDKNPTGAVYNYPMYVDGDFFDNLFKYHDPIDNPLKSVETHQNGSFYVDLCEAQLNLYGVFQDQYAQIGKIVKVEVRPGYDVFIRIGNINVDYNSNQIQISGVVIRKPAASVDDLNPGNIPVVTPEESGLTTNPGDVCFRWLNDSEEDSVVNFKDCFGSVIVEVVPAQERICAIEIYSATGGNLIATSTCEEVSGSFPSSPGSSTGGSGSSASLPCFNFVNLSSETALGVSYIDCNGNLVAGVDIPFLGNFCAQQITNLGTCGSIQKTGLCETCEPCCMPTVTSVSLTSECVPIGGIEFSLPDATLFTPYEFRVPIGEGTPPFVINVTSAPAWLSVTFDPVTNEIVFSGTPDEVGSSEVNFTITNCGTDGFLEVGTFIFVATDATANANADQEICFTDTATLAGSIAGSADSSQWSTDGDGSFDDDTLLNAVYTPGAGDISLGTVTLTLTAFVAAVPAATDTMILIIDPAAVATFDYEVPNPGHNYCQCTPENPVCIGNPISPNFTGGGVAGSFTATAGLVFFDSDPSPTGQVDIALTPPGTYTVTNEVNNSCGTDTQTADITILADCVRTISYPPGTFTTGDAPQSVVVTGGSIILPSYSAEAGLTINASTGQITPSTSTPGTYNVTVFFFCPTFGSCPSFATTVVIIT